MSNGSVFLSLLNSILLLTTEHLLYTHTPITYNYRDIDFKAGSVRFIEVTNNLTLTAEEKISLEKELIYNDYSHLDLPIDYKTRILNATVTEDTRLNYLNKYEYSGQKLAKSFIELIEYLVKNSIDQETFNILDYITDLGFSNSTEDVVLLANITGVINIASNASKLKNITMHRSQFIDEFKVYTDAQFLHLEYLKTIYGSYTSESHKPNNLPYLAMV